MTEIVIENTTETVIEFEDGPIITTVISDESLVVLDTPEDPIIVDLNSGPIGEVGSQILTGTDPPSALIGRLNDLYLVTTPNLSPALGNIYTKGLGGWVLTGNIRGATGGINTVNGYTGPDVTLTKTDVGLGNVANAAQVDLTTAQTIGGNKTFSAVVSIGNTNNLRIGTSTTVRNVLMADASGYATWGNPMVIAANKNSTDNSSTYTQQGVYIQDSAQGTGWPEAYGVILNAFHTNERGFQISYGKGSNTLRVRAAEGIATNGWRDWTTLANDATVVHTTGTETVAGAKTFSSSLAAPAGFTSGTAVITGNATISSSIELGRQDAQASTPFIDFHAGVTPTDYDGRIIVTTGTGTVGAGAMQFYAGSFTFTSTAPISGNGSGLTALNGSNISTGTVADARLSSNVVLLTGAQSITAVKTFTVSPIVPTPTTDTQAANKVYVDTAATAAVAAVIDSSPTTLDTLNELAAALGDDPNFATTVTNSLATKVSLTGDQTVAGVKTFSGADTYIVRSRATAGNALNSRSDMTLGSTAGDRVNVRIHENAGQMNNFKLIDMLHRRASGSDWLTTQWYEGVGVDTSYLDSPTTGASKLRTWILRDPNSSSVAIGDSGNTFLTLTNTAVTVGGGAFTGNGSGLTTLNGTNISSGTVADARLSSNVLLLTGAQTITAVKTFSASPVVPDSSFTIAKTTGLQAALDSKNAVVVIAEKAVTDNASTYPVGYTVFETSNAAWPETLGTVSTHILTVNRGYQIYTSKTNKTWQRSADNAATNGWMPWRRMVFADEAVLRIVHDGTNWPARPTYATYIEWVGPVVPPAATANDTWVNTSV